MRFLTKLASASAICFGLVSQAQAFDLNGSHYADVRGWRVVQNQFGCSGYVPGTGPSVIFNTPPAGGWQMIFVDPAHYGDVPGVVDVDKYSFDDTFYVDGGYAYGGFDLSLRKSVGQGRMLYADIGGVRYEQSLRGSTAVLLKLEECWTRMSGWTTQSNKAPTRAFK